MSLESHGLLRSERLLPLESVDIISASDDLRLLVIDPTRDGKLHDHVSFYWDQRREQRQYQEVLARSTRSTRSPTQFIGFPVVRRAGPLQFSTSTKSSSTSIAPPPDHRTVGAHSTGEEDPLQNDPTKIQVSDAVANGSVACPQNCVESTIEPPRTMAALYWISLMAPYERLLCPSLLFSPLLRPAPGGYTNTSYVEAAATIPAPLQQLTSEQTSRCVVKWPSCRLPRWGSLLCTTLWAVQEMAAALALPVHEAYLFISASIAYFEVVVPTGRVWLELESLWGHQPICQALGSSLEALKKSSTVTSPPPLPASIGEAANAMAEKKCEPNEELEEAMAMLRQPPQTFSVLARHLHILVQALSQQWGKRPDDPAEWLQAAICSPLPTSTAHSATAEDSITASPSPPDRKSNATLGVVEQLLRFAAEEWLDRRGSTVSTLQPTGSGAVALPMRDLLRAEMTSSTAPFPSLQQQQQQSGSYTRATSLQTTNETAATTTSTAASAWTVTSGGGDFFQPFWSRTAVDCHDALSLPPLPQDTNFLFLSVVWRRVLFQCLREPEVVRQSLRQLILGQAGQRCEELIKEWTAQRHQSPVSPSSDASPTAGGAEGPHTAAARPLDTSPLLPMEADTTSFRVYGPQSGEWLSSRSGGWSGFRGTLFCCSGSTILQMRRPHARLKTRHVNEFTDGALLVEKSETPPLKTTEELADLLCRIGASLPLRSTGGTEVVRRLLPAEAEFTRVVLQLRCLPLYMTCKRRGMQAFLLRPWKQSLALTMMERNRVESRVTTPSKLLLASQQHHRSAEERMTDAQRSLRMVTNGGLAEALALLESLCQQGNDRPQRCMQLRSTVQLGSTRITNSSGGGGGAAAGVMVQSVQVLLLRRAEESAIFSIFQCHPSAVLLAGCGVQRFAVRASSSDGSNVSRAGFVVLERQCGTVIEWNLRGCYDESQGRNLRSPVRCVPSNQVSDPGAALKEVLNAAERVSRRHVRGLLQYYHQAAIRAAPPPQPLSREEECGEAEDFPSNNVDEARASAPQTTLFAVDRAVLMYVLRHHPQYYSHIRGCGIAELYVVSASSSASHGTASSAMGVPKNPLPLHHGEMDISAVVQLSIASAATQSNATPQLVVARVCGRRVVVDVNECYSASEPYQLLPMMELRGDPPSRTQRQ